MKKIKPLPINLPMILTWARIAMIPLIIGVFYVPETMLSVKAQNWFATIMFIIAASTDALDGYLARRFGMTSNIGAFLDSAADKLVVSAALIALVGLGRLEMIIALVIIGREITVASLREWMAKVGASGRVKVNWYGKIKAIAQMVAIPCLLYGDKLFGIDFLFIGKILIYIAAVLTVYSMCVYMKAAAPYFNEPEKPIKSR